MTKRGSHTSPGQFVQQGFALHQDGDLAGAERMYRRALKRDKANADALYLLGSLLLQTGKPVQAERTLQAALKAQPGRPEAQFNLARVYMQSGRHSDAEPLLIEALQNDPDSLSVLGSLGVVRLALGNFKGAAEALERAVHVAPDSAEAWCDLAMAYSHGDQDAAAAAAFDKALSLEPDHARARHNRSHLRLRHKDFTGGWADYESRRVDALAGFETRPHTIPEWTGDSLEDRTILVWAEQGLGDQILQASMIPDVITRAGKVVQECEPRLQPLFARSFPDVTVVAASDPPDQTIGLATPHVQCPGGSLGQHLRTDPSAFPKRDGYLRADPDRVVSLKRVLLQQFGEGPFIGVAWQSSRVGLGPFKSTSLSQDWGPVFNARSDAVFVSLQYGDIAGHLAEAEERLGVAVHTVPQLDLSRDIDGLAALISALDLIITTSNTTAHLAGALGVPAWVLVPRGPARLWYWFDGETESLWYPSMRLFWQDTPGIWETALSHVALDLASWPVPEPGD